MSIVLDASALLAFLNAESGADQVIMRMDETTFMPAVNLAEVASKLSEHGMPLAAIRNALDGIGLRIDPFDRGAAYLASRLRESTGPTGLSLGDRACFALGIRTNSEVLTADRTWAEAAVRLEVEITLIR